MCPQLKGETIMTPLDVTEAGSGFSEIVNSAAVGGKRMVISRNGKEVAAVIPIADLHLLEYLIEAEAGRQDIEAARAATIESGENISLKDLKKELGKTTNRAPGSAVKQRR
jgi:prevent-host-death family protein